jgi:hypothetical protein
MPDANYPSDIYRAVAKENFESNHNIIPVISESALLYSLLGISKHFTIFMFFFFTNYQCSETS